MISHPFTHSDQVKIIKSINNENGTLVFPTETFYALGCNATSTNAIEKIYQLKNRSKKEPLLILVDSWEMLQRYAKNITSCHTDFLLKYWPGPLTVVFECNGYLSEALNLSNNRIAFRMTSDPVARDLIELIKFPLVGTSANLSGKAPTTTATEAFKYFGHQVDVYIDGGSTPGGLPSTIIDMQDNGSYSVIRKGAVNLG